MLISGFLQYFLIEPQRCEARQAAVTGEIAGEQEILQEAGDQHPPGGGMAGGREEHGECQRRHHRDVEKDRCRRGTGETIDYIEYAAIERHQRDQQQIGKSDPRQLNGKTALLGLVGEARREDAHGLRHEQQS